MKKIKTMNLHLVTNSLTRQYVFVDNDELQESLNQLGFRLIFARSGVSRKQTGYPVRQVVFTLLVQVFLDQTSIHSFLGKFAGFFCPRSPKEDVWGAFFCADQEMCSAKVLETCALRRGIKVFFKGASRTWDYSRNRLETMHAITRRFILTSIRYLLLPGSMKKRGADKFGKTGDKITGKLEWIAFLKLLRELFKAIIYGVPEQFKKIEKEVIKEIKENSGGHHGFFRKNTANGWLITGN